MTLDRGSGFVSRVLRRTLNLVERTDKRRLVRAELIDREMLPDHARILYTGIKEYIPHAPPLVDGPLPYEIVRRVGVEMFDPPFVAELRGIELMGRHAVARHKQAFVLESTLNHSMFLNQSHANRLYRPSSPRIALRQLSVRTYYGSLCSLINVYSAGYYHWLMEALTRLQTLGRVEPVPLLIDPDSPPYVRESLALLGYGPDRISEWRATRARVDRLLIPSLRGGVGHPSPDACRWLSTRLLEAVGGRDPNAPRRIYVSRADARRRRVVNEDAVMALLEPLGFVRVEIGRMAFADQVRLFSQAEIITGPHGAGLTNLIFAPQAMLLEYQEPGYINGCFYSLASGLGRPYGLLMADSAGANMCVDIRRLARMLEKLLSH